MTKTIYALLVAVDEYKKGSVSNLSGCEQDITAFDNYLSGRVANDNNSYKPLPLINENATRQNVIDGFQDHLGQAKKGDQAIFYFSGHGSRTRVPKELKHLEPDGLMESLVCHDSRHKQHADLVDKELSYLIYELSKQGAKITIILDCCHSGTGTRVSEVGATIRQAVDDDIERPLDSLIFMQDEDYASKVLSLGSEEGGWSRLPHGEHVLLAACEAKQYAKEVKINGTPKGIFSYFLLESLKKAEPTTTYRDLYMRLNALVQRRVSDQVPQLEAVSGASLNRPFLGGAIQPSPDNFNVSFHKELGWIIDAGEVHGMQEPQNGETARFALFPSNATVNELNDLANSKHTVEITKVMPTHSQVIGEGLKKSDTYKAVVTALPIKPLLVQMTGDKKAIELARNSLNSFGLNDEASYLVKETENGEFPALILDATQDRFDIYRPGEKEKEAPQPLVRGESGGGKDGAETAIGQLEHIARWTNLLELNQPSSKLKPDSVKLRFEVKNANGGWDPAETEEEIQLTYQPSDIPDVWEKPEFRMSIKNESRQRLFCMLLDMTEKFKIFSMTESDGVWLDKGDEFWVFEGDAIAAKLPDDIWEQKKNSFRDTLKLIVTTEESYAMRLEQGDLPIKVNKTRAVPDDLPQPDTLTRLMHRSNTRDFGRRKPTKVSDWYAVETVFTTIRPPEAIHVSG